MTTIGRSRVRPGPLAAVLALLALLPAARPTEAQADGGATDFVCPIDGAGAADTALDSRLRRRVTSASDPDHSYALLLPPGYDGGTPRPLLIVMDPRGGALRGLSVFWRAAECRGWIVMSSHDTRSDTTRAGNEAALAAMTADAEDLFSVDPDRLYLAGFSGTARFGWLAAISHPDRVAGLIGVGAGFPTGIEPAIRTGAVTLPENFAFWGGAGRLDFNFQEVRRLDGTLDGRGVPHRVVFYPGDHDWPSHEAAGRAIDWLELQAYRQGLSAPDSALVDALHREAVAAARRTDDADRPVEALDRWRRVTSGFEGLRPTAEARRRVRELDDHPSVRRRREQREEQAREHAAFRERMTEVLRKIRSGPPFPDPSASARELGLSELHRREAAGDTLDARAAGRMLEYAYVQGAFYMPRQALRAGEPRKALAYLEIAERARQGGMRARWFRARALTRAGRIREALAEVEKLVDQGFSRSLLRDDAWLEPLRDEPRWDELTGEEPDPPGGGR